MKQDEDKQVQAPRKARKAIKTFHAMFAMLRYELGFDLDEEEIEGIIKTYGKNAIENRKAHDFKRALYEDAIYIEETLRDLAVDKKIDHIRLIKKWEAKQKAKEDKNS